MRNRSRARCYIFVTNWRRRSCSALGATGLKWHETIQSLICFFIITKAFAGTDGAVYLWLTDNKGKSIGPIRLQEKGDPFERGQSNRIQMELPVTLRPLMKITVSVKDGKTFLLRPEV